MYLSKIPLQLSIGIQYIAIHSREVRVGKAVQHQAQPVNLSFNPPLNRKRQLEEIGVEIS